MAEEKSYSSEKVKAVGTVESFPEFDNDEDYNREPTAAEETLHRGLKARQISMIAVRLDELILLSM